MSTVTNVTEHIAGSELSTAAIATDTTLSVVNVNEFDQDGGYLNIGGTLSARVLTGGEQFAYTYTLPVDSDDVDIAPEDGSGVLNLTGALANPYSAGEPVYQVDANGKLFIERFAYVLEPDGEEELKLRVPHTLFALLTLGSRDEETAEQVTYAEDGTDLVVTDVLGKGPIQDLTSILLTTDPSQSGARVDIDEDGVREYEDDGTTVSVSLTQAEGLDLLADDDSGLITRMVRWLNSAGGVIARTWGLSGTYNGDAADALSLFAQAQTSSRYGLVGIRTAASAGQQAQIVARSRTSDDVAEILLGVVVDPTYVLLRRSGATITSDFEFATSGGWQPWTPTLSGWSANPTNTVYRYKQIGKMVVVSIRQATSGTSNATTKSITAPVAAATITNMIWAEACAATDNGADLATSSQVSIASGSSTINFAKDLSTTTGGWTNSGGHKIKYCTLIYEAA